MSTDMVVQETQVAHRYFVRSGVKARQPKATISKTGRVALNAACVRICNESDVKQVVIYWDTELPGLVIQAVSGAKHAKGEVLELHFAPTWCGFSIKEFLMDIGYDLRESRRFEAVWDKEKREFSVPIPLRFLQKKVA